MPFGINRDNRISEAEALAPMLLGFLGPIGALGGLLGRDLLLARRGREQRGDAYSALMQDVGPNPAAAGLEQLMNAQLKMQAQYPGVELPALGDIIKQQQAVREQMAQQQGAVDQQRMAGQYGLMREDMTQRGQMAGQEDQQQFLQAQRLADQGFMQQQETARQTFEAEQNRLQREAAATAASSPYGAIPAGHSRYALPTGEVRDIPNPGTEAFARGMAPVEQVTYSLETLDELRSDIELHGPERVGAGAQRQAVLYSQMIRALGDLNNAGVLQAGELEMIQDMLPDPTDKLTNPYGRTEKLTTALDTLESLLVKRGAGMFRQSPAGQLGGATPAEWGKAMTNAERNSARPKTNPDGSPRQ